MLPPCLILARIVVSVVFAPLTRKTVCQQDAVSVMDRSLRHAEWITEVQWYYPRLYQSPGFRRLTRLVKHQRVTVWPGGLGMSRFSVRVTWSPYSAYLRTTRIGFSRPVFPQPPAVKSRLNAATHPSISNPPRPVHLAIKPDPADGRRRNGPAGGVVRGAHNQQVVQRLRGGLRAVRLDTGEHKDRKEEGRSKKKAAGGGVCVRTLVPPARSRACCVCSVALRGGGVVFPAVETIG